MVHEMHLADDPFYKVYTGQKTIELRLFDEKRQQLSVGDKIRFTHAEKPAFCTAAEIVALHRFSSFQELYAALPLTQCGYSESDTPSPDDMLAYYSSEEQAACGVVGIEFRLIPTYARDLYRFEPFLSKLSDLWKCYPDWRFGQLMCNFEHWLKRQGKPDFYYLEEEEFLSLLHTFIHKG